MSVQGKRAVTKLGRRMYRNAKPRNRIAILAVAMTALLFTAMFTVLFSLNASYEAYLFRQIGGCAHGTFKSISAEQREKLQAHPKIRSSGERIFIGVLSEGDFAKEPAEIAYMDENIAKWRYALPERGRMPKAPKEIAMDSSALKLLGVRAEIGSRVSLRYRFDDRSQQGEVLSEEFTLVGFWEFDELSPAHCIHVSKEYAERTAESQTGKRPHLDLDILLHSPLNIQGEMEETIRDIGGSPDAGDAEFVGFGVNWGYTSSQLRNKPDLGILLSPVLFIALVLLMGYLIISNIFRISISSDVRFYGLLKTIGFTSRQLRRIVLRQAAALSLRGIPAGLALGYGLGSLLTPYILNQMNIRFAIPTISLSYRIFLMSAAFAMVTVFASCLRPARFAGKISPVEAVKYLESSSDIKKEKRTKGAKIRDMAIGSIARNRKKTVSVLLSIALSLVLLNLLFLFVGGFNMEKYLSKKTCADFIVSGPAYFNYQADAENNISEKRIEDIGNHTKQSLSGCGYRSSVQWERIWVTKRQWDLMTSSVSDQRKKELLADRKEKGDLVEGEILIQGLDQSLFEKVRVIEGDLKAVLEEDSSIALVLKTDDYGDPILPEHYPAIGDPLLIDYVQEACFIDRRSGEAAAEDTPEEFMEYREFKVNALAYTVKAYITIPYPMGLRFSKIGYKAMLPAQRLARHSQGELLSLFYLFDTPDEKAENQAENYLRELSLKEPDILYESKAVVRGQFEKFRRMFLTVGGLLCLIVGIIGILNYFNAVMSSFLSRKREFAILQAVGMTQRQLQRLLIWESGLYIFASSALSILLSILLNHPIKRVLEKMFWFFEGRFTIFPILAALPFFAAIGWAVPHLMFRHIRKAGIVDRIRE